MIESAVPRTAVHPRRWMNGAAGVLFLMLAACLAVAGVLLAMGFRPLVVRSGSMEPAINTGDLIFTRMIPPAEAHAGDVVTFRDPSRSGDLVTHRVIEIQRDGASFAFRTRGDANSGEESWSIGKGGTLGRYAFRVPGAGYVLSFVSDPRARVFLLVGGAVLLAGVALRRIWRS